MSELHLRLRASNGEVTTHYSTTSIPVKYPVTPTLSVAAGVLTWNAPYAQFTSLEYSASDFSTKPACLSTKFVNPRQKGL